MKLRRILAMTLAALLLIAATPAFDVTALAAYDMPYYIEVDITNQIVTIYSTRSDLIVRQMLCSTGVKDATPTGTYTLPPKTEELEREEWYYFPAYSCYAHYATRIYKGVLFHSLPCSEMSDATISKTAVADFGHPASHGCVRLHWQDAEFIAKCCDTGTRVRIFKSKKKNNDLRGMLYVAAYTNEKGQTYEEYLGLTDAEDTLGRNDEGSEVRDLQTRLRDLGIFNTEISGKYNGATVTAVREAQRLMDEEESGVANREFQTAIYADDAPTAQNVTVEEGMSGPVVLNMQKDLAALKLYDGAMDGVFDVDVREAVKRFQGAYAYRTDGVMTPEIQKALRYETEKVQSTFAEDSDYGVMITAGELTMGQVNIQVSIRLRQKATAGSEALGRLLPNQKAIVLEQGNDWSKVQQGTNVGYVKTEYLDCYPVEICALSYTGSDTDTNYDIGYTARQYYAGAKIPCEVFANYLAADGSLENTEGISTYARVNTEADDVTLNLRQAPNTNSDILAALARGTEVKVLLRSTEWSLVEWENAKGYLLNQYLEFWTAPSDDLYNAPSEADMAALEKKASAGGTLPAMVRAAEGNSAPVFDVDSEDAQVLGHLKNGVRVEVVETQDGWSLIRLEGHQGYMKDADLQFMLAEEVVT